jgi:DNA-binding IclR family transcriptional regulator
VILAARPAGQLAATFEGRPLVTPTGRRLNGVAELHAILDEVRKNGVAENHDETAIGLYTASVPVRNAEGVVLAALTVCVPTSRLTPERRERIVADLADAGRRLSELVSWLPAVTVRP